MKRGIVIDSAKMRANASSESILTPDEYEPVRQELERIPEEARQIDEREDEQEDPGMPQFRDSGGQEAGLMVAGQTCQEGNDNRRLAAVVEAARQHEPAGVVAADADSGYHGGEAVETTIGFLRGTLGYDRW